MGGSTDNPRREGTRTADACHPAGGGAGQCQSGLPRGGHLPRLVLSVAAAAGALRPGWRASAAAPGAPRPARAAGGGDGAAAAERGRQRGDLGRASHRGVSAASLAAARGPQHRAARPAPRGAGDAPTTADRARAPRLADGGAAHRADAPRPLAGPAWPAAPCGRARARRVGVPGRLLYWPAQGRGQATSLRGAETFVGPPRCRKA